MTKPTKGTARLDKPYLVATFENFPGVEVPLLSDDECRARGLRKPTFSPLAHLSPEERLARLSPLIDLLVEAVIRDISDGKSATKAIADSTDKRETPSDRAGSRLRQRGLKTSTLDA